MASVDVPVALLRLLLLDRLYAGAQGHSGDEHRARLLHAPGDPVGPSDVDLLVVGNVVLPGDRGAHQDEDVVAFRAVRADGLLFDVDLRIGALLQAREHLAGPVLQDLAGELGVVVAVLDLDGGWSLLASLAGPPSRPAEPGSGEA